MSKKKTKTQQPAAPAPAAADGAAAEVAWVLTPAGPVRADKLRQVGPGETVVQNEDGSYSVLPRPGPA